MLTIVRGGRAGRCVNPCMRWADKIMRQDNKCGFQGWWWYSQSSFLLTITMIIMIFILQQLIMLMIMIIINELKHDLADDNGYWTYLGSLTTPPCNESVTWVLFKKYIEVSHHQLNIFRNLRKFPRGEECPCHENHGVVSRFL